jgi:hypothetical protein
MSELTLEERVQRLEDVIIALHGERGLDPDYHREWLGELLERTRKLNEDTDELKKKQEVNKEKWDALEISSKELREKIKEMRKEIGV